MGRLTLNVLLSFAQFEREVTGERIRDKIAASKKKGMWMGGWSRSGICTETLLSLAFLAPALVQAITENRLPRGIGLTRLSDPPSDWSEQFKALGLQAPR